MSVIDLEWPAAAEAYEDGARVRVRESGEHGTVRASAGHFYAVAMDCGIPIIALGFQLTRAKPMQGWKPVEVK